MPYVPAAHCVQFWLRVVLYDPAAHAGHVRLPAVDEKLPAGHGWHATVSDVASGVVAFDVVHTVSDPYTSRPGKYSIAHPLVSLTTKA
jgi:hypothetical protein